MNDEQIKEMETERETDEILENNVDDLKLKSHYKKKLTTEQKIELLRYFLGDNVYLKSMKDTFTETELIAYIDDNLDIMIESADIEANKILEGIN